MRVNGGLCLSQTFSEVLFDLGGSFCFFFVLTTIGIIAILQNFYSPVLGSRPSVVLERRTQSLETLYIMYKDTKIPKTKPKISKIFKNQVPKLVIPPYYEPYGQLVLKCKKIAEYSRVSRASFLCLL